MQLGIIFLKDFNLIASFLQSDHIWNYVMLT